MRSDRRPSFRLHRAPLEVKVGISPRVRRRLTAALLLAGGLPAAARAQQPSPAAPPLVFDGVTVVDVVHGTLMPNHRVVIAGNRIRDVGDRRAVTLPPGAQVVQAQGKYLIPGLWDLHTHSDTVSAFYPLFIAHGVTGIRDAYAFISVATQIRWWREILAGTRVGPPRQLLAGQGPARSYEDMMARKAAGVNFLKLYPFIPQWAAAARRVGLPFGGHVSKLPFGDYGAILASDSGMSILDHVGAGGLDTLCAGTTGSIDRCRPVVEAFKRNGTWWVPTLVISARHHQRQKQLAAALPVYRHLAELTRAFWAGSPLPRHGDWLRGGKRSDTTRATPPDSTADSLGFLRVAQRAGVPILTGSDMGPSDVKQILPGFSLHTELAMLVAEGLTPLNALQSATINPATMFQATDSLGTVEPGKLADLVLLDADPLADITNTAMIRAVVANGQYFDRAALDQLFTDIEADRSVLVRSVHDTLSK